ncbi:geranylgeranylglycerol-phosphate geranylgeranyltransferase [Psychroflexus halocasei]|uniref:4-hydroxybenzoate polyprenyltransferase n=1 Tax=Psychroflexus halocasei TaxID=908615 RepID=A0A1H3VM74_9FLAO|nr:geranylgeranylglycerol-phosphate geranylgeranyltransferase [Psychroflexus halocasei]SDZ75897.1 4-hydroxybenzoate polyprenyltransferase [Psychroflexus halocasei]
MASGSRKIILKFFSLFSVVRGYNILVLVIAQYLASIFIMAPDIPIRDVVLDSNLFLIVLSSSLAIASGYIINNFYDSEKDLINRPQKTLLDNYVSQNTKLGVYFSLNFLCVILASYVAFKAVIFFSVYIFLLWLYSHKLKKYPFIGTLTASLLATLPFFIIFVYYQNFAPVIFIHAFFLFLLISIRELVKDLENLRGDFAQSYYTIPVIYGTQFTRKLITFLVLLLFIPAFILINSYDIGLMLYYFIFTVIFFVAFIIKLWNSIHWHDYVLLHNFLKFLIVLGIFSIALIDIQQVIKRLF